MKNQIETRLTITCLLILVISFFAIYIPVISFGFISDDFELVRFSFQQAFDTTFQSVHFRPIWFFSYPVVNTIFDNSSHTHHIVNFSLHLVNCLLAISIIRSFLTFSVALLLVGVWSLVPWIAFPIAWISQRNDLLMAFFLLLAIHQRTVAPWAYFTFTTFAFLSKVTCMFFPLTFFFTSGLKAKKNYIILACAIFGVMFAVSYWALTKGTTQEHLADLTLLLKVLNHAKNFVVGWLLLLVPVPFLFSPLNITGFVVMFLGLGYLIVKYAKITTTTKKYLIFSFFMSIPLAMTYDLRITYLQSLFLLIALFSSLQAGFAEYNISFRKRVGVLGIVFLAFWFFSVPATVATRDKFNTGKHDITKTPEPSPQNGYYPNNFYSWFREVQIRLLKP